MPTSSTPWLNILCDDASLTVGFTSRGLPSGGTMGQVAREGSPAYDCFNLCHYTGDDAGHVESCRAVFAASLGVLPDSVVVPRQTHSTNVLIINGRDQIADLSVIESTDALVTTEHGLVIGVSTADCLAVVTADPVSEVIGVAHAGWRGAAGGIIDNLVDAMRRCGASMSDVRSYFGPAICSRCFEVGEEVAARFPESCVVRGQGKPHVDLPRFARERLLCAGVRAENIAPFSSGLCTRCNPRRYFSARAIGVDSGRNFTFAMLKREDVGYLE